jgi:hypothetical protein
MVLYSMITTLNVVACCYMVSFLNGIVVYCMCRFLDNAVLHCVKTLARRGISSFLLHSFLIHSFQECEIGIHFVSYLKNSNFYIKTCVSIVYLSLGSPAYC